MIFAAGPFSACPAPIGETAATGKRRSFSQACAAGIASIGAMLRYGLDGQMITPTISISVHGLPPIGAGRAVSALR